MRERSYINLNKSDAKVDDKEIEEDLSKEDFEDEITKFSDLYEDYKEKKEADFLDDVIIFVGLFAIVASIMGVFILAGKGLARILK